MIELKWPRLGTTCPTNMEMKFPVVKYAGNILINGASLSFFVGLCFRLCNLLFKSFKYTTVFKIRYCFDLFVRRECVFSRFRVLILFRKHLVYEAAYTRRRAGLIVEVGKTVSSLLFNSVSKRYLYLCILLWSCMCFPI